MDIRRFLKDLSELINNDSMLILPVRNYSKLPDKNTGRDIDMAISRADIAKWIIHIEAAAEKQGLKLRRGAQYKYCRQMHLVSASSFEFEIDLLPRFFWRGISWLDERNVIREAVPHREMIMRPSEDHEFFITLNHSYLHGGFFPLKYKDNLLNLYKRNKVPITQLMNQLYGYKDTNKILNLMEQGKIDELNKINNAVRIYCLLRAMRRDPVRVIYGFTASYCYDLWLKVRR